MASLVDVSEVLLELGLTESCTDVERAVVTSVIPRAVSEIIRYLGYDPRSQERTEYYPNGVAAPNRLVDGIWEANDTEAYLRREVSSSFDELQVRHAPLRSITSLYIDYDGRGGTRNGAFSAETQKVEGVDFWPNYDRVDSAGARVCTDGIIRSQGRWPIEPGSVKIVYVAGYTNEELRGQDTVLNAGVMNEVAVVESARRALKVFTMAKKSRIGFTAGPLTSESLGDYSYSVDTQLVSKLMGQTSGLTAESVLKLADFRNLGSLFT